MRRIKDAKQKVAHDWLWSCTPFPLGLPSDEMLAEGRLLADGKVTVDELVAKAEGRMRATIEAMAK